MKRILSSDPWFREDEDKKDVIKRLSRWFIAFEEEIKKYQKRNPKDCPWWYGERTTLGLFLNAILQAENQNINFLQEFDSLKNDSTTRGRGDLLLWDEDICFLFEAKKRYSKYNADSNRYLHQPKDEKDEFKFVEEEILAQAKKYEIKELKGYLGLNMDQTYHLAICFDALLYPNPKRREDLFEKIFDDWKSSKWDNVRELDFYQFYHYSQDYDFDDIHEGEGKNSRSYLGMAVYGRIESYNDNKRSC